jgi:hypothetical protein
MLPLEYLSYLDYDLFENLNGIFVISHYKMGYRYISTYKDAQNHKEYIFNLLEKYGQIEKRKDWEIHHIVEGQHYADIDFSGKLKKLYYDELPCVFIEKNEHIAYSMSLHTKETDILYRDHLPLETMKRSRKAFLDAAHVNNFARLKNRLVRLENLYVNVYQNDVQLQTVAKNVFRLSRKLLLGS